MAYVNSDDMLLPGTLAYVAGLFHGRPNVNVVYGQRIFVDRDGLEIGRAVLPRHDAKALYWADYIPPRDDVLASPRLGCSRTVR